jgi:prepilin-type N-terminal cleavage/methylation domain-containing protein
VNIIGKLAKRVHKSEKGFTLIELLVVIAILGVLAAVAIPNIVGLMGKGAEEAATAEQGTIALAVSIYMYENDGAVPADLATLVGYTSTSTSAKLFQQPPRFAWTINSDGSVSPATGVTGYEDNPLYEAPAG